MGLFHRIALHGRHHQLFGLPPAEQERTAMMLYLSQTVLGTGMSVMGKLCSVAGMHFFFLVLVRSATLCLLLAPLLIKHRCNPFKLNAAFPLLLLRGFCGFASLSMWYVSLSQLPLSDAMALSFVSPVLVAVSAPLLLGEVTPPAVYWSIPACLAGMLMVAQPTWLFGSAAVATSALGVVAGLLQALASTGGKLTIRALNKHKEPLDSIMFSMGAVSLLGSIVGCLVTPGAQLTTHHSAASWGYLAGTSALAFVVQLAFTAAMRGCSASSAASLDYLSLLWTLVADVVVFRKLPSTLSLAGAALIAVASLAAILWTQTHPHGHSSAAAGGQEEGEAEEETVAPLTWKKTFYSADDDCHRGSEDEGVSLLAAVRRKDKAAAAAVRGNVVRLVASAAAAAPRSLAVALSPSPGKHATLAAMSPVLSDSSKSWRQGDGAGAAAASEDGGPALALAHATEGAASVEPALELVVSPGPRGMRTSSEKEAALRAAGK